MSKELSIPKMSVKMSLYRQVFVTSPGNHIAREIKLWYATLLSDIYTFLKPTKQLSQPEVWDSILHISYFSVAMHYYDPPSSRLRLWIVNIFSNEKKDNFLNATSKLFGWVGWDAWVSGLGIGRQLWKIAMFSRSLSIQVSRSSCSILIITRLKF